VSRKPAFLQYSKLASSDWQNICCVRDHGFYDFLSPFKHDMVLDLNFLVV
jgi:hypothetical protein